MKFTSTIEIDRPIAEVFDYANNHVVEWSPIVTVDEVIEEKPGHVGTTFRMVMEEHSRKNEFVGEVTKWQEPTKCSIVLRGKMGEIDVHNDFEDLGGTRTRMTQNSLIRPKGFFKVVFFLLGWAMRKSGCKAHKNELISLKTTLEAKLPPSRDAARADTA